MGKCPLLTADLEAVGIPLGLVCALVRVAGAITGIGGNCNPGPLTPATGAPISGAAMAGAGDMVRFLEGQGLSANASAGIVGNLSQESSLSPTLSGPAGNGLASWLPGWWVSVTAWTVAHALAVTSAHAQLAYIAWELHGGDRYASLLPTLNAAPDPQTAAIMWQNGYKHCQGAGPAGTLTFTANAPCNTANREQQAVLASQAAGGGSAVPVSLDLGTSGACAAGTTVDGPAAAQTMLAAAQSAIGGPYSQANHAYGVHAHGHLAFRQRKRLLRLRLLGAPSGRTAIRPANHGDVPNHGS